MQTFGPTIIGGQHPADLLEELGLGKVELLVGMRWSCHTPTHVLHLEEAHGIDLDVADAGVEKAGVAVAVALVLVLVCQ